MILDGYTHVAYVCRRHHGTQGTEVRVTLDPSQPPTNDHSTVVTIGTPTAWVIIRVLVESPEDLAAARRLQRSIEVIAPKAHPSARTERVGRATEIAQSGRRSGLKSYISTSGSTRLPPGTPSSQRRRARSSRIQRRSPSRTAVPGVDRRRAPVTRSLRCRHGAAERLAYGSACNRVRGRYFQAGGWCKIWFGRRHQAIENRSYIAGM